MASKDEDIPRLARKCWDQWNTAMKEELEKEKESAGFWIGGKYQWRDGEVESREGKNRPWMTINRCEPVVSQVENEARQNPPGPQAHPVGGGADKDGADILEGLIREYEYRCDAQNSYILSLRHGCARMRGAFDLATEYVGERSMEQQIVVKPVPNPELCFYDPNSVAPCREDAMWQGEIKILTRDQLIEQYGDGLKVLNRSTVQNLVAGIGGWMQDAIGWRGNLVSLNQWTGSGNSEGPYYVCVFWKVKIERHELKLYDNHILYFDDETPAEGTKPMLDEDGEEIKRYSPRRKIFKYVLTALDQIEKTEWYGDIIPRFWVLGPEMWRDGKCHRHSLLSGAIDSQRLLNYTVTSAAETVGSMTKAPFLGVQGQFDVPNAQGINPWENQNGILWPYLEYAPVWITDPTNTQQSVPAPPPQRNTWEAPIARLLELANFAVEMIKGATSVFFEPSLPAAQKAQSGAAIRALQSQSNIGTLNWQDALHRAVGLSYQQAAKVMAKLYDGERVRTIVKPDNSHEVATINREFPKGVVEHQGKKRNNIIDGQYSLRVTAGPNFQTRQEQSISQLMDAFKIIPQLLGMPGIAAQFLRMLGQGNPQIEQMADALMPGGAAADNPQAAQAQLAQVTSENQQLKAALQQMQTAIAAKLPEIEAKKWIATLDALAGIRKAEITASKDADRANADREASLLETQLGLAHDTATQAVDHAHDAQMQQSQQQAASQAQSSDQQAAQQQQQASQGDE